MVLARPWALTAVLAALMTGDAAGGQPFSPVPARLFPAGLWDKPNDACMTRCAVFQRKGCFRDYRKKNPYADPASVQAACDDKYSVCLYDCMCDTCDEDQIIIKEQ